MKFYNRKPELKILEQLRQQTDSAARMTVLTGRRRVGKTRLALEFAESHKHLYLFVAKKSEQLLCEDFLAEIKERFAVPVIGDIRSFKDIFALLLEISPRVEGYWNQIEAYVSAHSTAQFSHGICPECAKKLYPNLELRDE